VIDNLPPYPKYKDSGLPWLPKIPASWSVVRNGRLFTQRNKTGHSDLPILEVSLRSGVRVRDMKDGGRKQVMSDRTKYKQACAGDLAYNTMRMWQGAVGVAPVDGLVSPAYVVAAPVPDVDAAYIARVFRTSEYLREIDTFSRGIVKDRNRLYWEAFKQIPTPTPPLEEQRAIVRFLEHAERRMRSAINAKRSIIRRVEEQRQVLIHQAVTGAFTAAERRVPSELRAIGSIPHNWSVRRLKTLVHRIDQGVSPQAESYLADGDAWGVLKAGCVNRGVFREREHKRLPPGFVIDPQIVVNSGDTLISRACGSPNLVGSVGRVRSLSFRLVLSDKTFRPVFNDSVDPEFMVLAMNSRYYREQVEQAISGAEGLANNLPLSALRAFRFAVPPLTEQRALVERCTSLTRTLAATIGRAEVEIHLLREYMDRLTRDMVFGALDGRDAAARVPATRLSSPTLGVSGESEEALHDDELVDDAEEVRV